MTLNARFLHVTGWWNAIVAIGLLNQTIPPALQLQIICAAYCGKHREPLQYLKEIKCFWGGGFVPCIYQAVREKIISMLAAYGLVFE